KGIASAANCNPKGVGPSIWSRLELPSGHEIRFSDDLSVVRRVGYSIHPGTPGHTSGELQQAGIPQVHITARSIEIQRVPISTSGGPRSSLNGTCYTMAGGIR